MNDEHASPDETDLPVKGNRSRRGKWLAAIFAVGVVILLFLSVRSWILRPRGADFSIPDVDLTGVDIAIVDAVKAARQNVIERPYDAWGHWGMVLYAHEHVGEAVECLANAETLDPDQYRWPYLRGMILAEDNTAGGLPYVRRAASLAPSDDSSIRLRLAELLFDVRELKESEAIFRDVLQTDPENPRAKLGLARVLSLDGDPKEALRWAAGATRTLPDVRATHELLAKLLYRTGNQEAAEKQLQLVDRLPQENLMWPDPVLAEVVLLRVDSRWLNEKAHQYLLMGQPDRYIQALQRLVAEHPEDASLYTQLGRTLLNVKNPSAARTVLEIGLRRHPDSVRILYLWGVLHNEQQDFHKAQEIYRGVTSRKPDYPEAWNALAGCQRQLGNKEGAIESYRQVLRYEPFFPGAHVGLAALLYQCGRHDEAREHLKTALELAPDDPVALQLARQLR